MIPELLTVGDIKKSLRISRAGIYELAKKGILPSVRFRAGGSRDTVRFRPEDVQAFILRSIRGEVVK